jgi:phosphopantetheinyl transferase (holo-ACP synthase)
LIGVDIVDLTDPLLKPRSRKELRFISHPNDHCPKDIGEETLYWLLWAAKEAIFKAERQNQAFSPKEIEVIYSKKVGDRLLYSGRWVNEINGYSILKKDNIISVATTANIEAVKWNTFKLKTSIQPVCQLFDTIAPQLPPVSVTTTIWVWWLGLKGKAQITHAALLNNNLVNLRCSARADAEQVNTPLQTRNI